MHGRQLAVCALFAVAGLASGSAGAATDITIAHVYDDSGPLSVYGKQTDTGLMLGIEYETQGTMSVDGHKLVVIHKDTQGKPDVARAQLEAAYNDDHADVAVGATGSGEALAMEPIAQQYQKVLLVDSAVADSVTGKNWNRYVFRSARNSSQDAIANARALDQPGVEIATLAQDYAFGRDGIKAFKGALKNAKVVHEEYLPLNTTDFTAAAQHLFDSLKDQPGRKVIFILWAGQGNPFKIADLDPQRYGIQIATGGNILPALAAYKRFPGMEGATYYYYGIPKNKANDWLVSTYEARYKEPPDFFTVCGVAAGIALVDALKKTGGDPNADKLIGAMEGMSFETPKGAMTFRKQDHQAMQSMYHFKIAVDPKLTWAVPELVNEIKASDMDVPIENHQ
ncbi:substrate-binding domain-containing protein [Paraburkholderia sp. B3]|uniref:substrate-binding domain-containing protein n=1 Tax=Paraburkholderia sp. B3 TaxID=3134791 RepID=UPI00398211AB